MAPRRSVTPVVEQVVVGASTFKYDPTGSPWAFTGGAGVSGNKSGFTSGNPPAPQGVQVAFLQDSGWSRQNRRRLGSWVLRAHLRGHPQRGNFGVSKTKP